jgi:uncharacterized membrane protein YozB (DUF420 family)
MTEEKVNWMKLRVGIESMVLIAICLADMAATLYYVLRGAATEQNPLMAACINYSPTLFVFVKIASFMPFVIAVELYRRKNPAFARRACLCAIALYLLTFTALTLGANVV